ncbi:YjcZ family sporulation protein [Paenibacillus sp. N4]|nr:YjcZ family sporulation protein [Paenibacillus vietnamensis]MCA0755561.1 YjcZ family sporulation protein [Paenibacillus vietnamensis]
MSKVESANQGYGYNGWTNNIGIILVLFILLVIIACTCMWY